VGYVARSDKIIQNGRDHLESLVRRWGDNIEMDLKEIGVRVWS
jgi:hypothetical protein